MKTNPVASKESSKGWYTKSPLRHFGDSTEATGEDQTHSVNHHRASQEQTKPQRPQLRQPRLRRSLPPSVPFTIVPSPTGFNGFSSGSPASYSLPDTMMGQAIGDVPSSNPEFQLHSYLPATVPDGTGITLYQNIVGDQTQVPSADFWPGRSPGSGGAAATYSNLLHASELSLSAHAPDLQPGTHEHVAYQYSRAYPPEFGVSNLYTPSGTGAVTPSSGGQFAHDIHYNAMAFPGDYASMPSAYGSQPASMTVSGENCPDPYASAMPGIPFNVPSEDYDFNFMALDHTRNHRYNPQF